MTLDIKKPTRHDHRHTQAGMTLVELMVALAVGSFLILGAVQVYNQSRQAYAINDAVARVQETAQFAMDTIEADLRMANNWGMNSLGDAINGRSTGVNANPLSLTTPLDGGTSCGATWAFDLERPVVGTDAYALPCAADNTAQANSDTLTIRRGSMAIVPRAGDRLQIESNLTSGQITEDAAIPTYLAASASQRHDLLVNTYYVDANSALIPGVPTLRRKTLASAGGNPTINDLEVAPGVENLQIQFGVDMNGDNTVDRYMNPGNAIINPGASGFVPGARILTARVWLVVRSLTPELGIVDTTDYEPGNVDLGVPNDEFRRLMVSKTILLRNARAQTMGGV